MKKINDYEISEQICSGKNSNVYRAVRIKDGQPVVVKTHAGKFLTDHKIKKYRREFEIGKSFNDSHIVQYSSFIQAFQGLVRQLLTESDDSIVYWKAEILQSLGENAQVIIEVIPEVEMIIGPQPPVPILGALENQNRFNRVFQNFSNVFSQKEHPLVIFLDDLQWADFPTLNLIKLMMTNPDFQYLFFIGAYRDNEVDDSHPLIGILNDIQKEHSIEKILLMPLDLNSVNFMIADAMNCSQGQSKPLATLVNDKTQGNPFFVNMFLKTLYQEDLIGFDIVQKKWKWDLQRIKSMDITDNVIDLMVARIRKLSPDSQYILSLASCIGNQFNLKTLSLIHGDPIVDTYKKLWDAVRQGLVLPIEFEYKWVEYTSEEQQNAGFCFLHDRVQQAASSLIQKEDKPGLHLKIGRLFLSNMKQDQLEDNLFEVVNHLNQGKALINDSREREQLAGLNLRAAKKAKLSSAYEPALNYITEGMECLPEDSWVKIKLHESIWKNQLVVTSIGEQDRKLRI